MNNKASMKKGIYFVCAVLLLMGAYLLCRQLMGGKVRIIAMNLKPSEITIDRFDGDYIYAHNNTAPRQWAVFDFKEKQIVPWDDVEYERTGDLVCVRKTTNIPSQYSYTYYDRQGKKISQLTDYFVTEFYQGYAAIQKSEGEPILLIDKNYRIVKTLCDGGYNIYMESGQYAVIGKYLVVEAAQQNTVGKDDLYLMEIKTGTVTPSVYDSYTPFIGDVSLVTDGYNITFIDHNFNNSYNYEDTGEYSITFSQNKNYFRSFTVHPLRLFGLHAISDNAEIFPLEYEYLEVNAQGIVLLVKNQDPEKSDSENSQGCFLANLKGECLYELPQDQYTLFQNYVIAEGNKSLYFYKNKDLYNIMDFEEIYTPQVTDIDYIKTNRRVIVLKDSVYYRVSYQ